MAQVVLPSHPPLEQVLLIRAFPVVDNPASVAVLVVSVASPGEASREVASQGAACQKVAPHQWVVEMTALVVVPPSNIVLHALLVAMDQIYILLLTAISPGLFVILWNFPIDRNCVTLLIVIIIFIT